MCVIQKIDYATLKMHAWNQRLPPWKIKLFKFTLYQSDQKQSSDPSGKKFWTRIWNDLRSSQIPIVFNFSNNLMFSFTKAHNHQLNFMFAYSPVGVVVDAKDKFRRNTLSKTVTKILHLHRNTPSILILNKVLVHACIQYIYEDQ